MTHGRLGRGSMNIVVFRKSHWKQWGPDSAHSYMRLFPRNFLCSDYLFIGPGCRLSASRANHLQVSTAWAMTFERIACNRTSCTHLFTWIPAESPIGNLKCALLWVGPIMKCSHMCWIFTVTGRRVNVVNQPQWKMTFLVWGGMKDIIVLYLITDCCISFNNQFSILFSISGIRSSEYQFAE